jgi:hypothetical protein
VVAEMHDIVCYILVNRTVSFLTVKLASSDNDSDLYSGGSPSKFGRDVDYPD